MPASGSQYDLFGAHPGQYNGLIDVPGISVGHAPARDSDGAELSSGVTVVVCPRGATGAVDVRGGGPGTRETDLLKPSNTVQNVHAIALCGGSAFGLDAAGGVMAGLESRGIGYPVFGDAVPDLIVPIVPAAVIFDLAVGDPRDRPDATCGREALDAALTADDSGTASAALNGCLGAGRAAAAGAVKGGFGQASAVIGVNMLPGIPQEAVPGSGWTIAVGLVANPVGSAINPATGWPWGLGAQLDGEFDQYWAEGLPDPSAGGLASLLARGLGGTKLPVPSDGGLASSQQLNTTIGVIATDAPVTKAQAERLAMAAHDGLARAVRPAHLPMDGDTFFALSTGGISSTDSAVDSQVAAVTPEELAILAAVAADCAERAVVHAVLAASTDHGVLSWKEMMYSSPGLGTPD